MLRFPAVKNMARQSSYFVRLGEVGEAGEVGDGETIGLWVNVCRLDDGTGLKASRPPQIVNFFFFFFKTSL